MRSVVLLIGLDITFNVHIQSKLLYHTFVVTSSSDLGQPFRPRPKKQQVGLCSGKNRFSRYDIRTEGSLPFSINGNNEF